MKRLIFLFLLAAGFSAGAQYQVKQVAPDTGYKFSVALPVNHDVEVVAIMSSADSEIVSMTSISDYNYSAPSQVVAFSEPLYSYSVDPGIRWSGATFVYNSNYDLILFDADIESFDYVQRE